MALNAERRSSCVTCVPERLERNLLLANYGRAWWIIVKTFKLKDHFPRICKIGFEKVAAFFLFSLLPLPSLVESEALGEKSVHLKVSDLHFLMALTEVNRKAHFCLNIAIDTINSIPLNEQKARFITAYTEVIQRKTMQELYARQQSSVHDKRTDSLSGINEIGNEMSGKKSV